jgi:hypothetical protein
MAAAVAPTRQGVLGITRITLRSLLPRASSSEAHVTPAAMLTTSLDAKGSLFSERTTETYWGLVAMNMTSAVSQTCSSKPGLNCLVNVGHGLV